MGVSEQANELARSDGHVLAEVFRQLPAAAWTTDRELHITRALGQVRGPMGVTAPELVGMHVRDLTQTRSEDDPALRHHVAALRGHEVSFRYQLRERWYEVHVDPLRDDLGRIAGCIGVALDITSRVSSEKRTLAREKLFTRAEQLAHVGSMQWDFATRSITWSDEMYRIHGVDRADFLPTPDSLLVHVHPDDRTRVERTLARALEQPSENAIDVRIIRPDGEIRSLHVICLVFPDETGRPARLVAAAMDMTEWERARQRLLRTVSLLEATIESTADGILVIDLEGKVVASNHRFAELWRIPETLLARRDDEVLLEFVLDQLEDLSAFLHGVRELYGRPDAESLDVLRFKDGRVFERYSRPQRVDGEVEGRVWSFRDVSEREQLLHRALFLADASRLVTTLDAEKALHSIAQLFVPRFADACAVDLVEHGVPRRLCAISTLPPPESLPEPRATLGLDITRSDQLGEGARISVPLVVLRRVVGVLTIVAVPPRSYDRSDIELVEEVARRCAIALENSRLYRAARDEIRAREEFLAVASHEIRGPIASIRLAVDALRNQLAPAERLVGVIEREERRLEGFVDELLDIGRIQAGQLHFVFERVDLSEIVRAAAARIADDVERSGSTLTIRADEPCVGSWDRRRLDQVIANLLTNAIKFGLGKPVEVTVGIRDGHARLSVTDHGLGIRPEMQRAIFEPFERAVPARHYGGLGLGLYIVRTIVEGLGGSIAVSSAPGAGSTFLVELPLEAGR